MNYYIKLLGDIPGTVILSVSIIKKKKSTEEGVVGRAGIY